MCTGVNLYNIILDIWHNISEEDKTNFVTAGLYRIYAQKQINLEFSKQLEAGLSWKRGPKGRKVIPTGAQTRGYMKSMSSINNRHTLTCLYASRRKLFQMERSPAEVNMRRHSPEPPDLELLSSATTRFTSTTESYRTRKRQFEKNPGSICRVTSRSSLAIPILCPSISPPRETPCL